VAKRLIQRILEEMDRRDEGGRVRRLEMAVDACLDDQVYAIQFWHDVRLYGVREALSYLQGCTAINAKAKEDNCAFVKRLIEFYCAEQDFAGNENRKGGIVMEIEKPKYYEIIIAGEMKFVVVLDAEDKPEVFCANLAQTINKSVDWNEFHPDW